MPLGLGGKFNYNSAQNDPFYQWGQFQQDPDFDWTDTPVIGGPGGYLENNPEVIWNRFLTRMGVGIGDSSNYANWLRDQFRQAWAGFQAGIAENPNLTFGQYTDQHLNPNALRARFNRMSPWQRGERASRFMGPTRTIADI